MLRPVCTPSENPDFRALIQLLAHELTERDGAESAFYAQYNKPDLIRHAVVAYAGGKLVGCGAFKEFGFGPLEIKRTYVQPARRRQGVARAVLNEPEA